MDGSYASVYHLRNDYSVIATYQRYTREGRAGLVPEHGLFGSPEWWKAVEDGRIPVHVVDGKIASVEEFEGHEIHGPMYVRFDITGPAGTHSETISADLVDVGAFTVGQPARLKYVMQRRQEPFFGQTENKITLEVLLGN